MADNDATPQKRVLPARERRESAAKRRASSPPKPPVTTPKAPATPPATEPKPKRQYIKRSILTNSHTPVRHASVADSIDDLLPARLAGKKQLPTTRQPQSDNLSPREYQKVADSAILMASLHRSRMQWLCDGVFKKYWTKPVKRKGQIEAPPNNPDAKSMIKLGPATISIEPYIFDATFYIVRDTQAPPVQPVYRPPPAPVPTPASTPGPASASVSKPVPPAPAPAPTPAPAQTAVHPPTVSSVPPQTIKAENPAPSQPAPPLQRPTPPTPAPAAAPRPQPPSNPRTNDPVIQMLAARAAQDNRLKDLMKVVATSRASPEQLREFQTHINEFTLIAERQKAEQERLAKLSQSAPKPTPPKPHYAATYPTPPRPEPPIKHIVVEFTSPVSHNQAAISDRWLFPDHAVLDLPYAGLEMTCSFLVERKGSEIPGAVAGSDDDSTEGTPKYEPDVEYYEPVTITVRTTQHRVLETIAKSAKTLSEVQKHMQQIMEKKTRAPQGYLVHQLPKEKPDATKTDFIDSAVELSAEEEDELKAFYPM